MARPLRIEYPGASYHVVNRGNRREQVFHGEDDYLLFLERLSEYADLFDVEVCSYCLMPNHYHLQLKTRQGNLGKFMQSFNTSYTLSMNRRYSTSGHLFQGRYKAQLIQAELYKNKLSRYIHLNPVKVKSLKGKTLGKLKAELHDYRWSSFRVYIGLEGKPKWLNRTHVLSSWGNSPSERIRNYRRYVEEGLLSDNNGDLTPSEISNIIGTDSFKDVIFRNYLIREMKEIDPKEQPELARINTAVQETIIDAVMMYYKLDNKSRIMHRKGAKLKCRRIAIYLSSKHCRRNNSLSGLAERYGITLNGLSASVSRFKSELSGNKKLEKELKEIEDIISHKHK
jgi:REP element-mobilizing transposase RayT